jgi:hypothetical protein
MQMTMAIVFCVTTQQERHGKTSQVGHFVHLFLIEKFVFLHCDIIFVLVLVQDKRGQIGIKNWRHLFT